MTLSYLYNGGAITHKIAPSTASIESVAENGATAFSSFQADDPAATLETLGHRPVTIEESACSQPRLFTGWTTERGVGRVVEAGLHGDETTRGTDVTLVDVNALWNFRLLSGTDAKRPEETWADRLAWLLASDYLTGLIEDTGYIIENTVTMDAADYTDGYPSAVMQDLMDRTAGAYNYFAFWDPVAAAVGLWVGHVDDAVSDSTLSISNVVADIDSDYCFAPDPAAQLSVTPTETYSEVIVTYKHDGSGRVWADRPTTAAKYIRRGTTISRPYTGSATTAAKQAEKWLDEHANEEDRITVTIIVPASRVGLLTAGQRIEVKFSHLTNYTSFTWMRCVRLTVTPTNDLATHYSMTMELLSPRPVEPGLEFYAEVHYSNNRKCPVGQTTLRWENTGDDPAQQWHYVVPLLGDIEYVDCATTAGTWKGLQVNANATVDVHHGGMWAGVDGGEGELIVDICQNGVSIANYSWTTPGPGLKYVGESVNLDATVAAESGDVFTVTVYDNGHIAFLYYRPSPASPKETSILQVSGTGTTGSIVHLPPPPGATIESPADPTVNDDVGDSYLVGQVWVNTTSGEVFILVDNTLGAAVWATTSTVTLAAALDAVDFLVGTAQADLGAAIVVGATPGGELGGTWASPTITAHPHALDDLSDVDAAAPADGDALTWTGTDWVPVHAVTEDDVIALITPDVYACASLTVISAKGSIAAGAHTDLHAVGGTTVQIDETNTTPGFNIEAAFTGVDGITNLYVHGYYDAAHTVTIELYNYDTTSWDVAITMPTSQAKMGLMSVSIADGTPYFDGGGNAVVRFYHAQAGNQNHRLYLDYLAISHAVSTPGVGGGDTTGQLVAAWHGGGAEIEVGTQVDVVAPYDGTITGWTLLADQTGDAVVDVWVEQLADYPPTNADSITAAAPPTLTAHTDATSTAVGTWTAAITAGDVVRFNLDSVTDCTRLLCVLDYSRP